MTNKDRFFYSALHPATVALYLAGQMVLGMFVMNPIFVAISLTFSVLLCLTVCGKNFYKELRFYIPFYLIVAISNPLFSHNGATVLFFLNGRPITYEATIYGIVSSGMFLGVLLWCRAWSAIMTEEKLIYLIGRKFPKTGMVLSVSFRMIPRFREKWREIREVQRTLEGDKTGFVEQVKGALMMFSALMTDAMESSIETGTSMEARGYGLKGRTSLNLYKFRKSDVIFVTFDVLLLASVITFVCLGFIEYSFYPTLSPVVGGRGAIVTFVLFAIRSAMPLVLELKEEIIWKYSRSKI